MSIVIVDIDETLVYSRKRLPGSIDVPNDAQAYDMEDYTIMRPSAPEFLKYLSQKYDIISVTQGVIP